MPTQLWELSTREFVDMYLAHLEQIQEDEDKEMQRTAWFTSHLMNATGNIKRVTPEKLYKPLDKRNPRDEDEQKEYVNNQRETLLQKFNIDDS